MAVPSSGQLRLNGDINLEINGTATGTDVSLNTLSSDAGFSAPNGMKEFYGYVDAVAPSVSTLTSTSVTSSSMTIRGNVTSDGGGTITERGFYFGTDLYTSTNNTKYTVSGTTGSYSRSMTGLSGGTHYGIWAYATNSVGTTIGSRVLTQTTTPTVASAINLSGFGYSQYGSEVDVFSAGSSGYLVNNTGTTITFTMNGSLYRVMEAPNGSFVTRPSTFTLGSGSTWTTGASWRKSGSGNGSVTLSASGYSSSTYSIFS